MSEAIFNLINQNLSEIKSDIAELRLEVKESNSNNVRLLEQHVRNCSWKQIEGAIKKHLTSNNYNTNYYMISKKGLLGIITMIATGIVSLFEFLKSVLLK